ncbi:M81 family metallopeptidase [Rheinheimera baltica]|uniref:Microcystinase C n=1 Tax=Rheinheimera baltica TaxID=67576 RepID=A0ABT9I3Y1_9GAMM|nr:M81 family metallopeptidase [Rheinheimera baltica]MDP5138098.1 M81 family metallopeptidase [Rheinheimera baltica]MDP5148916.1 M81 family metallopeptidase [Rheinheimera baltica]
MRIFTASLATETNTFSPMYTDVHSFYESFYAPPGQHPATPTLCSAPLIACREFAAKDPSLHIIEGSCAWAEPGGLLNRQSYEFLRDEILQQLRQAMPVQAVLLGLHGAMVAQGYDDCEGDLLQRVRDIVGPGVIIGATLDPHSHLTAKRQAAADLLIAFKEFPHLDFMQRARELVHLALAAVRGEITPAMSSFDCRMIDVLPTSYEPMKSFIDKIRQLEQQQGVLSISVIHGFMAGDVADMGTKLLVITDNQPVQGEALAKTLGMELFSFRGQTLPQFNDIGQALDLAQHVNGTVVLADVWDNPGGGVAGDGTLILEQIIARNLRGVAVGTIWDPMAVKLCFAAGEGADITLRFGGKSGATAGPPIDKQVTVVRLQTNAQQQFADSSVPMGDCALITFDGIEVILNSNRCQSFDPSLFRALGIAPEQKKLLLVKSTNHFYQGFAPLAAQIIYVDAGAPYPSDPARNAYTKLCRPLWPITAQPFG